MSGDDLAKARYLLRMADELGAGIEAVYSRDPSSDLLDGLRKLRAGVIEEVRPLIEAVDEAAS